jgi:hypothetical protein
MPVHLPPISRRQFLAGSLAAGAGWLLPGTADAAPAADPNRWALLADTHIWERRDGLYHEVKPAVNLAQARAEILALRPPPAAAIVAGDTAFLEGHAADYALLLDLLKPIRTAGVPVHLALGNHDDRENFRKAIAGDCPDFRAKTRSVSPKMGLSPLPASPVAGKCVAVLETPRVNWFLLDSLQKTDVTAGALGKAQLDWLAQALDARRAKPAIVLAHHYLFLPGGLDDTDALLEVLIPRRQVKAYIFGHSHAWRHSTWEGIHLLNLPAVAWVFDNKQPHGWVDLTLTAAGAAVVLHALDKKHPKNGERLEMKWRSDSKA